MSTALICPLPITWPSSNYIDVSCSYEPQTKPRWPLGDVMNAFIPKYIYLILSDLDLYDTSWEHLDKNKLMVKL